MRLLDLIRPPTRALADSTTVAYTSNEHTPVGLQHDFETYDQEGFKGSPPVYSLIAVRAKAFAEVRFVFRNRETKELSTPPRVAMLNRPWPGATAGTLLALMEVFVSLAGNAYIRRLGNRLEVLRPDWVNVIAATRKDGSGAVELEGYLYWPGGRWSGHPPVEVPVDEMAHYIEMPDPTRPYLGQSWLTATTRDVDADTLMARHRGQFFKQAGTPNLAVMAKGKLSQEQRAEVNRVFQQKYEGWENAYKTVTLEGGADLKVVGNSMEQMSFSTVQAAGETRIAAAAGIPPVVVGFLQGIQAATYSNYSQAMRRFADLSIRPMWRNAADALAPLVNVPTGSELWYDDRDIPFLQQDAKDQAEIRQTDALTIEALIRAGYTPETSRDAVVTGDFTKLEHTGLTSVQLLPPGDTSTDGDTSDDDEDRRLPAVSLNGGTQ